MDGTIDHILGTISWIQYVKVRWLQIGMWNSDWNSEGKGDGGWMTSTSTKSEVTDLVVFCAVGNYRLQ